MSEDSKFEENKKDNDSSDDARDRSELSSFDAFISLKELEKRSIKLMSLFKEIKSETEDIKSNEQNLSVTIEHLFESYREFVQALDLRRLESLSVLKELGQLDKLEDLDKLKDLSHLKHIDNLTELGRLDSLEQLDKLTKLDELSRLDKIDEFKFSFERLSNSGVLDQLNSVFLNQKETLSHLKELDKLSSLETLSSLNNLAYLKELSGLDKLAQLKKLDKIDGLSELDQLDKLANLESLNSLDELKKLESLQRLDELKKLDQIGQLSELERLDELKFLDSLENLNKLQDLEKIQQLSQLDQLKELKQLDELENLKGLDKLEHLTQLEGLERLDDLEKLKSLDILSDPKLEAFLDKANNMSLFKDKTSVYILKSAANTFLDFFKVGALAALVVYFASLYHDDLIRSKFLPLLGFSNSSQVSIAIDILDHNLSASEFEQYQIYVKERINAEVDNFFLVDFHDSYQNQKVLIMLNSLFSYSFTTSQGFDVQKYVSSTMEKRSLSNLERFREVLDYHIEKKNLSKEVSDKLREAYVFISNNQYEKGLLKLGEVEREDLDFIQLAAGRAYLGLFKTSPDDLRQVLNQLN